MHSLDSSVHCKVICTVSFSIFFFFFFFFFGGGGGGGGFYDLIGGPFVQE